MATHQGGIFSRAAGTTSGIIFSDVRTKRGKKMASRGKVIPQDANTPTQQGYRNRYSRLLFAMQLWGPEIYREIFNRAVGQLAGFQALESAVSKTMNQDGEFENVKDIASGNMFGWESGEIDAGVTEPDEITIEVDSGGEDYPIGTRLTAFGWTDFDGDWRTVGDTQIWKAQNELLAPASTISVTVELDENLVDTVSQSLYYILVEGPENSKRPKSRTRGGGIRLEIQEIVNNG